MKPIRYITSMIALSGLWLVFPKVSSACERCFGAGSDSPIITAIGISMLALLAMIGVVFTGIISFFNQANNRSQALAENEQETSDTSNA